MNDKSTASNKRAGGWRSQQPSACLKFEVFLMHTKQHTIAHTAHIIAHNTVVSCRTRGSIVAHVTMTVTGVIGPTSGSKQGCSADAAPVLRPGPPAALELSAVGKRRSASRDGPQVAGPTRRVIVRVTGTGSGRGSQNLMLGCCLLSATVFRGVFRVLTGPGRYPSSVRRWRH